MSFSLVYTVGPDTDQQRGPVEVLKEDVPDRGTALTRARTLMADARIYGIHLHGDDGSMLDDVELARELRMKLRRRIPYTDQPPS
ncbi:hypothetical protein QMO56_25830 [Roseomonas sp. E05]|uniref:hypothetical protein n=1 Tax=Roseomonas sp. E05 TaxID=3046310 RepID=UPI0024B989CD|nr:hypothetical protein [Roseomonas sp. E05]MDJ0391527.1 hypothetical protein [Roseomonas sp. E05]